MKKYIIIAIVIFINEMIFSQWAHEFTSQQFGQAVYSGWINFEKTGEVWENRFYYLNGSTFNIMSGVYPATVQYTYTLTPQEILADRFLYSLWEDVTGDNIVDFYVMSAWGEATNYRYSFKIFDITTGQIIFERNDPSFSYSYPEVYDVDNDGILECIYSKCIYPSCSNYYQEVYSTGYPTSGENITQTVEFELKQNYPNPFNPSTSIEFFIDKPGNIKIAIYDIRGALVRTLLNNYEGSGNHKITWNGLNDLGLKSASGIYFYNLRTDEFTVTKKMVVLK